MEKDNKNELATQKDNPVSVALAVFVKDPKSWYLYKKSEKISKAFFLLTRHLPDDHMLKNHMREKALDLMAMAQSLLSNTKPVAEAAYGVVLEAVSLISLSDTALASEVQSERNHSVVVRELETFISELSAWARERAVSSYIPASMFDMSDISAVQPEKGNNEINFYGDSRHPYQKLPDSNKYSSGKTTSHNLKNNKVSSSEKGERPASSIERPASDMRKSGRQESIIQAIRVKGEVSITDLVVVVKGCSEKTIQRELISLVHAGIISKTGERRWSRYSVV